MFITESRRSRFYCTVVVPCRPDRKFVSGRERLRKSTAVADRLDHKKCLGQLGDELVFLLARFLHKNRCLGNNRVFTGFQYSRAAANRIPFCRTQVIDFEFHRDYASVIAHRLCGSAGGVIGQSSNHSSVYQAVLLAKALLHEKRGFAPAGTKANQLDIEIANKIRAVKDAVDFCGDVLRMSHTALIIIPSCSICVRLGVAGISCARGCFALQLGATLRMVARTFGSFQGWITGEGSMRVLVVDDHRPWRNFASKAFQGKPEWQVVGEATDGLEAVQQATQLQPDLILLDVGLPTINGIEAARRIRQVSPASKILFLSENRSLDIAVEALKTGAGGYVVKSDAGKELLRAVKAVLQGAVFLSSTLLGHDSIRPEGEHMVEQGRSESAVAPSQPRRVQNGRHELRLYSDDAAFVGDFAHSIEAALEKGKAVVVVATESHRAHLVQQLKADGVDIDAACERKSYIPLDVSDSLSTATDISIAGDGSAKSVPHAIAEAVRTAQEKHLHLAVG